MRFRILLILLFPIQLFAQQAVDYSQLINTDSLSRNLRILTSDSLEGRETGKIGQKRAAHYLFNYYQQLGLDVQLQRHALGVRANGPFKLNLSNHNFTYYQDYYYVGMGNDILFDSLYTDESVWIAGFGINQKCFSEFTEKKISGKSVLVKWGQPHFGKKFKSEKKRPTQIETLKEFIAQFRKAALLFVDVDSLPILIHQVESDTSLADYLKNFPAPVIFLNRSTSEKFMYNDSTLLYTEHLNRILAKGKPASFEKKTDIYLRYKSNTEELVGQNVFAFLKGNKHPEEAIVISSHYDHLGIVDSAMHPGADDNGSGTSGVMEMARIFKKAKDEGKGPDRSIIFMNVSGEEKGLYGSSFYVKHPIVPLAQTVADLNIDMIGRVDDEHDSLGVKDYIYLIGADRLSNELAEINKLMNDKYVHLELDDKYDRPGEPNRFYERSDHYNFAKNNIPVIFYFNGMHGDYHQPTDTFDKIDFSLLKKRVQLVFLTGWELSNRLQRIELNKQ